MTKEQTPRASEKEATLANVALLYYGEGLTQGDIARRMKVSRATIVNMLREARDMRIVDIRVDGKHLSGSALSTELRAKFDLQDVYIATCSKDGEAETREEMLRHLGRVGAVAVADIVDEGDRVGVAWGETILSVSEHMSKCNMHDVSVHQLIGSMISDSVPTSEKCTIDIANMLSAACYTLHAPALASSAEVAALFKAEPTIHRQLEELKTLDMTIASIGHVGDDTHLSRAHMVSADELADVREAGAVGIICCRYIDADGQPIKRPPDDRLIAVELENLVRVPKKLLVVGGANRKDAVLAAIKGGLVTHLCIDSTLAQALREL